MTSINALVICNHAPPPAPGEGGGIAKKMSTVFTFTLSQSEGEIPGICAYIGKKAV